jgi:hypothetical protein
MNTDENKIKVIDQLQYALKINANSMYGCNVELNCNKMANMSSTRSLSFSNCCALLCTVKLFICTMCPTSTTVSLLCQGDALCPGPPLIKLTDP